MLISCVGAITVRRLVATQSQSNYFYGCATYWEPGGSSVDISWWEGHKTIKSANEARLYTKWSRGNHLWHRVALDCGSADNKGGVSAYKARIAHVNLKCS